MRQSQRPTPSASLVMAIGLLVGLPHMVLAEKPSRPNIVWISCEDISPHLGCYGDPHAITPHLDQLAREGVRYTHAFTTAGVCAPCRSGIITGMYQTTLGTHHMRCTATLPDFIKQGFDTIAIASRDGNHHGKPFHGNHLLNDFQQAFFGPHPIYFI